MKKFFAAAAAASLLFSSAASAAVAVDDSGVGFVGKGDVQLAFGWNNAAAQANVNGVSFSYETDESYAVTCEWDTVTGGKNSKTIHHAVTNHKSQSVSAGIAADPRKKGQWVGYNLNGFSGTPVVTGEASPNVGDSCPQGGGSSSSDPGENDAVVTAVDIESTSGGLYVSFGGNKVPLPNTPII
jgi:hypothetical protein